MDTVKCIVLTSYTWLQNEWKWIVSAGVIGSGLLLLWIGYKMILFKLFRADYAISNKKNREDRLWAANEEIIIPLSGRVMPITQVPDTIFSKKMVGDGFAVEPVEREILSPVKGIITQIYSNGDAIVIKSCADRNVILHIGINTSALKGAGINFHIKEGDLVEAGESIGDIDLDYVTPKISSIISPVVFTDLNESERIVIKKIGMVEAGEKDVIAIEKEQKN